MSARDDTRIVSRPWLRGVALVVVLILYAISIPWYRSSEAPLRLILGLPDWATVAFVAYALAAVANAVAWYATPIADEGDRDAATRAAGDEQANP